LLQARWNGLVGAGEVKGFGGSGAKKPSFRRFCAVTAAVELGDCDYGDT
jgi:hypothetical protein